MKSNFSGMQIHSFWAGGSDETEEGVWKWVSDGSEVIQFNSSDVCNKAILRYHHNKIMYKIVPSIMNMSKNTDFTCISKSQTF
jgi:hypothetical protein